MRKSFPKDRPEKTFYGITNPAPSPDEEGKWEVLFYLSGSHDVADVAPAADMNDVRDMLENTFGDGKTEFEFDVYSNGHIARVDTEKGAQVLASCMAYFFQQMGYPPASFNEVTPDKETAKPAAPAKPPKP